ncbi:hypothetical protein C8Q79DRAFT_925453 [Trametes meyenii]|nr:hypothetical protein C8Q79DRAFT_925453 [Trametes meyenii]
MAEKPEPSLGARRNAGFSALPVSSTAFVACHLPRTAKDSAAVSKDEALKQGLHYICWNGREQCPLIDKDGVVFAVLAGSPNDPKWTAAMEEVRAALDGARHELLGNRGHEEEHRHGFFPTIACGISYRGGQKEPTSSLRLLKEKSIAASLLANHSIQRVAGFGSATFRLFAPKLHAYYSKTLDALEARHPHLKRNFKNLVFARIMFNLGPRTVTYIHIDQNNLPAGLCAITALGDFDPMLGGHLILWDLGLVIEFPLGAMILIPSALLHHSNVTICSGETRYSLTQYSAGRLFRWVECGFKTKKEFEAGGGTFKLSGSKHWAEGVGLFSKWSDLKSSCL